MKAKSRMLSRMFKFAAFSAAAWLSAQVLTESQKRYFIRGKVVLITGGSRGLGLILARKFANEGAKVAICARSEESLEPASKELSSITNDFMTIPCDITDKNEVRRMVRQIKEKMGGLDIVINNAGIIQAGPMEAMNQDDYEQAMKVHFWGPFYVINEVLPDMINRNAGRIVNIVSIGGKVSFPHMLPYNTSKFALSGYSEGLAAELDKHNVKVTTIYPGLMRTGSPRNIDVKGQQEKEYAWFKIMDSIPVLSMDANRAATQIIDAVKKGTRTLTLTIPAKLAIAAHGIAPSATVSVFEMINTLFPDIDFDDGIKKGYESTSNISESFVTKKSDEAARQNLQM